MAYQNNRRTADEFEVRQPRARFNKNEFLAQQAPAQEVEPEVQQDNTPRAFVAERQPREDRAHQPRHEQPRDKKFNAEMVPLRQFEQMLQDCSWVLDIDPETGSFHQITAAQKAQTDLYYTAYRNGAKHMEAWYRHQVRTLNEKIRSAAREAAKSEHTRCQAELITGDADFDEFARQVRSHDWYHTYSDDGDVWRRGNENQKRLEKIVADQGGIYQKYWEYYQTTHLNKTEK